MYNFSLFKILTKQLSFDDGEIFIDKNKTVGYLSQHLNLDSENTIFNEMLTVFSDLLRLENKLQTLEVKMNEPYDESNAEYHNKLIKDYTTAQELYTNRGGYTYKGEINRVLKGLGFFENDFDKLINTLSGGQKTRVALCKLLLLSPDILLLDEPTNHLDLEAIEWLEDYLKSYKGTVLVISHDRFFLDSVTTKTFQEKSIKAAESREKALNKIERIDVPDKDKDPSKISFETAVKSGYDVLHIEKLSKSYENKHLFSNVSLDLKRGDKIALIGENGRGKTTLFKIIMDKVKQDSGVKTLGTNVNVGYYDQEQSNLSEGKTILDEVWDDFPYLTTSKLRGVLGSFLFKGDDVFKTIDKLSGGEKCRINLLKLMLSKSNLLLLDEPTNHLDIMSREALEDAILSYDGTLIVISHDRYFLNKVIDKIVELEEDGLNEYLGNYSYYVEKKKNPQRFESLEEAAKGKTKTQIKEDNRKKREAKKEEKAKKLRIKTIESDITKAEEELNSLQESQCLEEVYSNPVESERVNKEIKAVEEKLEQLYEEWEELSAEE